MFVPPDESAQPAGGSLVALVGLESADPTEVELVRPVGMGPARSVGTELARSAGVGLAVSVGIELIVPVGIASIETLVEMFEPHPLAGRGSEGSAHLRALSRC